MVILKKSLDDEIVQLGLIVMIISGIFLVCLFAKASPAQKTVPTDAPTATAAATTPAVPAVPVIPPPTPIPVTTGERSYTGEAAGNTLNPTSKVKGKWVVDQSNGLEADTTTIAQALFNAQPGERIEIKPGHYKESIVINKDITIVGLPTADGKIGVKLEQVTEHTIVMANGKVAIENLDIVQSLPRFAGVLAKSGTLRLTNIGFHSPQGAGIFIVDTDVTVERSAFAGNSAVQQWSGTLLCNDCTATNNTGMAFMVGVKSNEGVSGRPRDTFHNLVARNNAQIAVNIFNNAEVTIDGCDVSGNMKSGLAITQNAVLHMKGCTVSQNVGAGFGANHEAKVDVTDSKITRNEDGFVDLGNSTIVVTNSDVSENTRVGYAFEQEGKITFVNTKIHDNRVAEKAHAHPGPPQPGDRLPASQGIPPAATPPAASPTLATPPPAPAH